jgi:hypothetical protein
MGEATSFGATQETMGLTIRGHPPVRRRDGRSWLGRKLVPSGARGRRAKGSKSRRGHFGDRGRREPVTDEVEALRSDDGRRDHREMTTSDLDGLRSTEEANALPRGRPAASAFGSTREQTRRKAPWFGPASFPTRGMATPNLAARGSRLVPSGVSGDSRSTGVGRPELGHSNGDRGCQR